MNNNLSLYCIFLENLLDIMRDIQLEGYEEDEETSDFIEKEIKGLDLMIEKVNLTILLDSWGKNNYKDYLN